MARALTYGRAEGLQAALAGSLRASSSDRRSHTTSATYTMKYDDASWHYGGEFPDDLPPTAGATHNTLEAPNAMCASTPQAFLHWALVLLAFIVAFFIQVRVLRSVVMRMRGSHVL